MIGQEAIYVSFGGYRFISLFTMRVPLLYSYDRYAEL